MNWFSHAGRGWRQDLLTYNSCSSSLRDYPRVLSRRYCSKGTCVGENGRPLTSPSIKHDHISQFSRSVLSDSLRPHGLQHGRLPCPSPTPCACSSACSLGRRCHPTISSSVVPFSSCLQYSAASGSFPMSQFFASGDQNIVASASVSVPPMNIQD